VTWRLWLEMPTPTATTETSLTLTAIVSTLAIQNELDSDPIGAIEIQYGPRTGPVTNYPEFFRVAPPPGPAAEAPAPVPSGSFQKRRSLESQHKFDCPAGHTFCWTGERQQYACMDTSSDVTGMSLLPPSSFLPRFIFSPWIVADQLACGRCPYAASNDDFGGDCTSIEGADDVQCLRSKCVGMSFPTPYLNVLTDSKRM